jgi:hypothetical protein
VETYLYRGPAGSSRVTKSLAVDGAESLQGTTDLVGRARLSERASVNARGRLQHAEIAIAGERGVSVRFTLDPKRATVQIERAGAEPITWRVPGDAPWLYSSPAGGALAVTPVAAWIALRAARASDVVRVLEPELQRSHLVTIDQIAVPTELGTTIALGHGADVDERFITELRDGEGDAAMRRVPGTDPDA